MSKRLLITIPKPCHENWDAMTPVEKGRFCSNCQKIVTDFTHLSDREIARVLSDGGAHCGQLLPEQLGREYTVPGQKPFWWVAAASSAFAFLMPVQSAAQTKTEIPTQTVPSIAGQPATGQRELEFSGQVSDETDGLPGVSIAVKGTDVETKSDIDGNFSIRARENDILVFSFVGMEDKVVVAHQTVKLDVVMTPAVRLCKMTAMLGGISVQRRSFCSRALHSIGNIFRKKENRY
jgi:hypothetical protein